MNQQRVPDNFPRESPQGAVSGAQPKLLLRKVGDTYCAGLTDADVYDRYIVCDDLAQQLAAYASHKMRANSWSLQTAVSKVEAGVLEKVRSGIWDFSAAEVAWTIERTRQILADTAAGETSIGPDSNILSQTRDDSYDE
ncbi:hypothetical protein [Burkholderia pseudomallei]|uniref:hypothetical protein n=1 Tax=Burkholderia pseudomallei TaxID=28450 RepID=UPI000F216E41|nr:hypothetical protein [Burkholderia pseudomallei]VBO96041.1 Uncharacterised protein [Burkholderia pseudomallei]VBP04879.1 Uncharacterised protein [Burkholderia pseudomallei]